MSRMSGRDYNDIATDDRDRYYTSFDDEEEEFDNSDHGNEREALAFGSRSERHHRRRRSGSSTDRNLSPRGDTTDFTEEDIDVQLLRRLKKRRSVPILKSETETDAPPVRTILHFPTY